MARETEDSLARLCARQQLAIEKLVGQREALVAGAKYLLEYVDAQEPDDHFAAYLRPRAARLRAAVARAEGEPNK